MTYLKDENPRFKFLPKAKVLNITGYSATTLWRQVKRGDFPPPVKLSPNRVRWPEHLVEEWAKSKIASI